MTEQQIKHGNPNIHSVDTELDPSNFEHPLYYKLAVTKAKLDLSLAERDALWAVLPKGSLAPPKAVIEADYAQQLACEIADYEKQIERHEKLESLRRKIGEIVNSFRN